MKRLIVGISGAFGAVYGIRALQTLRDMPDIETHLVLSPSAKRTILAETDWEVLAVEAASVRKRYAEKFPLAADPGSTAAEIAAALAKIRWYKLAAARAYFIDNSVGFGHRDQVL